MKNIKINISLSKFKWKVLYIIRAFFYLFGKSWNDFYSWMLDFQDRKLNLDLILSKQESPQKYKGLWDWHRGEYFLKYLKRHGFKKNHTIFDLGCGYGRATIPILKYLDDKGAYIGSEISKVRLSVAEDWIKKVNLENKRYRLCLSKDNKLNFIDNNSIDIVWVFSVFNHMPDNVIEDIIQSLHLKMKNNGLLFAYFITPQDETPSVKTFPRTEKFMENLFTSKGFTFKKMNDYDDDYDPENRAKYSRMYIVKK
tara:strand:- start:5246 stop:6007 length:762 start_codon:yes stop_codon:yes gene_type:complete